MIYRLVLLIALLRSGSTAACTVEPRSVDDLLDLWYGPAGTPVPTPPSSLPLTDAGDIDTTLGEPADAASVDAINGVAQEWIACRNASEFLRLYALGTDDFAARQALQGDSRDEVRATLAGARLRAGDGCQDDAGVAVWDVAAARHQSLPRLPRSARVPTTLNSYSSQDKIESPDGA